MNQDNLRLKDGVMSMIFISVSIRGMGKVLV